MTIQSTPVLPFAELLDELRRHGFVIGLDQHLRMQQLLDHLAGVIPPERLKTHLAPIFATSREEQERFHRIFDRLYPVFAEVEREERERISGLTGEHQVPSQPVPTPSVVGLTIAGIAIVTAVVLFGIWRWATQNHDARPVTSVTIGPERPPGPLPTVDILRSIDSVTAEAPDSEVAVPPPAEAEPEEGFLQRHRTGTRVLIIATALGLFLFNEWRAYQRRRLVVSRERRQKPPFTWPVRLESPTNPFAQSPDLPNAARLLRQREAGEVARLSVEETVTATIAALGFPTFRYRSDTRAPDYLLLIERSAYRDHTARLYQALGRSLEREGVHVTRYLHDGDPRICYSENGDQRELLVDLRRRFPDYRLLLFTRGDKLVDPVSGRLHSWTTQFLSWSDRAVLTPDSPAAWGLREVALAQHFVVLPATTAGLAGVVGHFRGPARPDPNRWRALDQDPAVPRLDGDDPLPALQSYLGPRVYRWLCACAVYPELHWDLTLHFGGLSILGPGLITEENLLRLLRLPWFRQGVIPDQVRSRLIEELSEAEERAVREAIVELLERNPAPGDSVSANRYELDLVVQRLALHRKDPKERRAALKELAGFPRRDLVQDFAMLKLLEETPSSRLQVLLPRRMRRMFYRSGVPVLGVRTAVRTGGLAAAIVGALFLTRPTTPTLELDSPNLFFVSGSGIPERDTIYLLPSEQTLLYLRDRSVKGNTISDPANVTQAHLDIADSEIAGIEENDPGEWFLKGLAEGTTTLKGRTANGSQTKVVVKVAADPIEFEVGDTVRVQVGGLVFLSARVPSQGDREVGSLGASYRVKDSTIGELRGQMLFGRRPGRTRAQITLYGQSRDFVLSVTREAGQSPDSTGGVEVIADPGKAIEQVVKEYVQAATNGDIDGMVKLYPGLPRAVRLGYDRLGSVRGRINARDWRIESSRIGRDSAALAMTGLLNLEDGNRKLLSSSKIEGITLARRGNQWIITGIQSTGLEPLVPVQALSLYSRALQFYEQGNPERAREMAQRALAAYPVYAEAEGLLDRLNSMEAGDSTSATSLALRRLDSLRALADRGGRDEVKRYNTAFDSILLKPTQRRLLERLNGLSEDNRRLNYNSAYALLQAYLITTVYPDKAQPDFLAPILFNVWRDTLLTPNSADSRLAVRQFMIYSKRLQEGGATPGALDSGTVRRARAVIAKLYNSDRDDLYAALLSRAGQAPDARPVQFFRPTGGPALLLAPTVGSPFTAGGYTAMQRAINVESQFTPSDGWVTGAEGPSEQQKSAVAERLRARYQADYAGRWMAVLARTQFTPFAGMNDASTKLLALAGRNSQLLQLIASVATNTMVDSALSRQFEAPIAFVPGERKLSKEAQFYTGALAALAVALEQASNPDPGSNAIDRVRERMNDAREAASAVAAPFLEKVESRDVARLLLRLLLDPIERVEPLLTGSGPAQVDAAVGGFCGTLEPLLAMKPFNSGGQSATLDQVNAVFHPNSGSLWRLLDDQLAPYLIRVGNRFVPKPGSSVQFNPQFLDQINRAVSFSQALYPPGELGPRLTFALQARPAEGWVASLAIGEVARTFDRTRTGDQPFVWLGIEKKSASLAIAKGTEVRTFVHSGTWAIFDLFAEASGWSGSRGRYRAEWEYESGDQSNTLPFELTFTGAPVLNPEWLGDMACEREATIRPE